MIAALLSGRETETGLSLGRQLDFVFGRALPTKGDVIPDPLVYVVETHLQKNIQKTHAHGHFGVAAKEEDDHTGR